MTAKNPPTHQHRLLSWPPFCAKVSAGERVASEASRVRGARTFNFELREPLTPPYPLRGEGDQPPCQIKCDSPAARGRGTRCGKRRAPRTIAELSVIFS